MLYPTYRTVQRILYSESSKRKIKTPVIWQYLEPYNVVQLMDNLNSLFYKYSLLVDTHYLWRTANDKANDLPHEKFICFFPPLLLLISKVAGVMFIFYPGRHF